VQNFAHENEFALHENKLTLEMKGIHIDGTHDDSFWPKGKGLLGNGLLDILFKLSFSSSQLSQSQVQVKLEPPEDGPIIALNGDSEPGDDHYDSTGMNGDSYMETGVSEEEVRQW